MLLISLRGMPPPRSRMWMVTSSRPLTANTGMTADFAVLQQTCNFDALTRLISCFLKSDLNETFSLRSLTTYEVDGCYRTKFTQDNVLLDFSGLHGKF